MSVNSRMGRATPRQGAVTGAQRSTPRSSVPWQRAATPPPRGAGVAIRFKEAPAHPFEHSTLDTYAVRNPKVDAAPGV